MKMNGTLRGIGREIGRGLVDPGNAVRLGSGCHDFSLVNSISLKTLSTGPRSAGRIKINPPAHLGWVGRILLASLPTHRGPTTTHGAGDGGKKHGTSIKAGLGRVKRGVTVARAARPRHIFAASPARR